MPTGSENFQWFLQLEAEEEGEEEFEATSSISSAPVSRNTYPARPSFLDPIIAKYEASLQNSSSGNSSQPFPMFPTASPRGPVSSSPSTVPSMPPDSPTSSPSPFQTSSTFPQPFNAPLHVLSRHSANLNMPVSQGALCTFNKLYAHLAHLHEDWTPGEFEADENPDELLLGFLHELSEKGSEYSFLDVYSVYCRRRKEAAIIKCIREDIANE
ncbi:hypothetical protein GGU11DRAFT_749147 [Lentinula aff. detonsa]|nr:hypothetical protein GGU11DRAFT_749147 [Lentinula aff. detonsa]